MARRARHAFARRGRWSSPRCAVRCVPNARRRVGRGWGAHAWARRPTHGRVSDKMADARPCVGRARGPRPHETLPDTRPCVGQVGRHTNVCRVGAGSMTRRSVARHAAVRRAGGPTLGR
eukprot:7337759-Pyramimonas_sp.AAC.1